MFNVTLAAAQQVKVNLTTLKSSTPLSQNTIQAIYKDSFGFMWFGTQDGLNRFDGYEVQVYKHIRHDSNSLPGNSITAISEDSAKNLWVGTRINGLSKFNRKKRQFLTFEHKASDPGSLSNNTVSAIYTDKNGNIWIGTASGLNLLIPKTRKFKQFHSINKDQNTLTDSRILSIFQDGHGNLWVGTANGLNLWNAKIGSFTRYYPNSTGRGSGDNAINTITADDHDNLWIGTNSSLITLNRATRMFSAYAIAPDRFSASGDNPIFSLAVASNNRLWIGSNTTLQLFDIQHKRLIPITDETGAQNYLPNDGIYTLLEDKSSRLWIGTTSEGILKYDRNLSVFPSYQASLINRPTAKNIIRGIAEDIHNNLYFATDAGLTYFDRKNLSTKTYQHDPKNKNSLISNYTTSVITSKKSNAVWVGTYGSGLDRLNPATGKVTHYLAGTDQFHLNCNAIDILLEDRKGNIWVGTDSGGLNVIHPDSQLITKYLHNSANSNSVCDDVIMALHEDKKGNIWIGGYSNGISIFDPVTKQFTSLNTKNSKLSSDIISVFYEDAHNNMWIGTMEGGLNRYNLKTKTFTLYSEQNGLINNAINYINADSKGTIWVSTNRGITSLEPNSNTSRNYDRENGLNTLEFCLGGGTKLRNGEIVLGSINGLNIIDGQSTIRNKNKPRVVLSALELFNKPVLVGGKDAILQEHILTTKKIKLKHEQSVFTIKFAALEFTAPGKNKYAYMLEGFDAGWNHVGNHREATYTNLNPGTYTFKVKAANNDGVWSDTPTTLEIVIVPAIWMTWYFKVLVSLLIVGVAYGYYRFRIGYIKKQNAKLEKLVKKRTLKIALQANNLMKLNEALQSQTEEVQSQSEELQAQSDELYAQSKELGLKTVSLEMLNLQLVAQKNEEKKAREMAEEAQRTADKANLAKSTFLATMSHEIRTPLNGVLGMASLLAQTELNNEQEEYTSAIVNSGESLMNVINDVLDFSKIESGHLELDCHEFDLRKCIQDVFSLFTLKLSHKEILLESEIDPAIPARVLGDSYRLRQILVNLVGNAMKFTNKGRVHVVVTAVYIEPDRCRLCFEVRDTGIGIAADQLENLFRPFNQIDSSTSRKYGGTGLGLVICQRLIALMGGHISVTSKTGEGSCFTFQVECHQAAGDHLATGSEVTTGSAGTVNKQLLTEAFAKTHPFHMLIAEDNLMNQKLITRVLNKLGYSPDLANNGREAVEMLAKKGYDLILMDVQMPEMDGLQATQLIRERYGSIPLIVAMTANAMNEDKENCINAGMDDYLSKPLDFELLTQKLADMHLKLKPQSF
jgi:signal transduction histidine kinase/ligand-binding sensor domain-containing protein/ActR/RegA family two-component response regulator